jgi:hypothetical protein
VELHPNGLEITVSYLVLLPYKQPQWCESHEASVTSNNKSERRLKMAFTYARVTHEFTVASYPQEWSYPVALLLQVRDTDQTEQPCVSSQALDFSSFRELVPRIEY